MEFKDKKSIFIQIADHFSENIMTGEWQKEDRIPSVREMAVQLEVNPNTVMRAYAHLQEKSIIYNKRGIGYFVSPDALKEIKAMKKEDFMSHTLPEFYKTVKLLEIDMRELAEGYERFLKEEESDENKQ